MEDYFILCAHRFQKWFECDMTHYLRAEEYAKNKVDYPCIPYFNEAQFACADDQFEFMLELAYYRQLNNMTHSKFLNVELFTRPTIYDNPEYQASVTYTY